MRVSGKLIIAVMFAVAIGLGWMVRLIAPRSSGSVQTVKITHGDKKPRRGYRNKEFPSMEQSRAIAEREINRDSSQKKIVTKVESQGNNWLFFYETEKYLNSGNSSDRLPDPPILVHQDGTTEFVTISGPVE